METRHQVLQFITMYPGIHLRRLERELGLSSRLASYHVGALESSGLVHRVQEAGFARIFPKLGRTRKSSPGILFVCLMRRPVALQITLLLLASGEESQGEIASRLRIARPSASYHLSMLAEGGILASRTEGRNKFYFVADSSKVKAALANFNPLPDDLDAFSRVWDDLFRPRSTGGVAPRPVPSAQ